jgi:DNA-directed RNA polymerase specialized sigma24 family protein
MSSGNSFFDSVVSSTFNFCCGCCFPKREDHQGSKGCIKRCGNPCRRITKRCNEWLGIPNYPPMEKSQLKVAEEEQLSTAQVELQPNAAEEQELSTLQAESQAEVAEELLLTAVQVDTGMDRA